MLADFSARASSSHWTCVFGWTVNAMPDKSKMVGHPFYVFRNRWGMPHPTKNCDDRWQKTEGRTTILRIKWCKPSLGEQFSASNYPFNNPLGFNEAAKRCSLKTTSQDQGRSIFSRIRLPRRPIDGLLAKTSANPVWWRLSLSHGVKFNLKIRPFLV